MKLLAFTAAMFLGSVALDLVGQVTPAASEIAPWAQLTTAGALIWVVGLLIGELRATRADGVKQREEFNVAFSAASERHQEQADKDRAVMMSMVTTCSANRQEHAAGEARKDLGLRS